MKIGDQKVQRTLRKQKVKGLLQDKKVPGTSSGTRATAAPGRHLMGLPQDSWERAKLMAPTPAKQGSSSTERDLVAWSHRAGNKDEVVNPQRLWVWLGRVESWVMWGPDPDSPRSGWRGGLCERTGPSVYGVAGLSRRNCSKRKRHSGAVWGSLLQQQLQSPLHPVAWHSPGGVGGMEPISEAPGTVCTLEALQAHIWGIRRMHNLEGPETTGTEESVHHRRPHMPTYSPGIRWDNKTWNCEKTRVGPKEGASQQLRQWNNFHFATPEKLLQVIVYFCISILFIILISLILLVFLYLSSFCLVFFTWLVNLHCLTGFPLFSLS